MSDARCLPCRTGSMAIHRLHADGLSGMGSSPASESSKATNALSFADDRGGLGIHQIT
jgi:hypothetical protein